MAPSRESKKNPLSIPGRQKHTKRKITSHPGAAALLPRTDGLQSGVQKGEKLYPKEKLKFDGRRRWIHSKSTKTIVPVILRSTGPIATGPESHRGLSEAELQRLLEKCLGPLLHAITHPMRKPMPPRFVLTVSDHFDMQIDIRAVTNSSRFRRQPGVESDIRDNDFDTSFGFEVTLEVLPVVN